jgi:uncharacterized protein GlcG (DUF336 family)
MSITRISAAAALLAVAAPFAGAQVPRAPAGADCSGLPGVAQLRQAMVSVAGPAIGGLFNGAFMWAAVVNRDGEVCAYTTSTADPSVVWPGSQAIAKAKAYTANAFSNNSTPLSTAQLYTFTQPGHSLWGLNQSNPFDPDALQSPGGQAGIGRIAGGIITFGGGLPIYRGGQIVGGLGISGDTACADHEVAKGVRSFLGFNPPGGALVDDISYSTADGASVFTHPLCVNTMRNGIALGQEPPAAGF